MKRTRQSLLALPALLGLSFAPAADAACNLPFGRLQASKELAAFNKQVSSLAFQESDISAHENAVSVGYLLGRQVRYIGNRADRREMFDCLHELALRMVALKSLHRSAGPIVMENLFLEAEMGAMNREDLARCGVNTSKRYPSIFDRGIAGMWRNERQPAVGMIVEEADEGRYRCCSFGAIQSGAEENCVIEQVGEHNFVMSFVVPPSGRGTQPQNARIPLNREGDRLVTPGPGRSLIYLLDRSAEDG